MRVLSIALFGIVGVLARYYLGEFVTRGLAIESPAATFTINLAGAFAIGAVAALGGALPTDLKMGVMVGLLGGFTTFSSYCLETLQLLETGRQALAAAYFLGSPLLGLACAAAGLWLARRLAL